MPPARGACSSLAPTSSKVCTLASCAWSVQSQRRPARRTASACPLRVERALQLRGACGLDEPCGGISASLSVCAPLCPAPLRASLAPAFSRSRTNGRAGSSTLRLCRAVSGAPIGRRPPCAVSGALVDRCALSRRAAPLAPCARVFALACEWSSWKLDPTSSSSGSLCLCPRHPPLPGRSHLFRSSSLRPSRSRFRARARMVKCVGGSCRSSPDSRFRARARMVKRKARPYGFAVSPPACPSTGSPAPLAPCARVLRFVRGGRAESSTLQSCWGSPLLVLSPPSFRAAK